MQPSRSLGLVLSGGGVRGVAHVGVLQALHERGILPNAVAGASAGAIVGALYAAGHSTEAMLDFFLTRSPFRLSKLARRKPGLIDTDKIVADFLEFFPDNSFESLAHPLFVTATDILEAEQKVFDRGPLIPAILASSAFPAVFTPVQIEGSSFMDGGIVNNFPVEPLVGLCDYILGVYVSPLRSLSAKELRSTFSVSQRALEVGMYYHSRVKFGRCDRVIVPSALVEHHVFDTEDVGKIFETGYREAQDHLDDIEKALAAPSDQP